MSDAQIAALVGQLRADNAALVARAEAAERDRDAAQVAIDGLRQDVAAAAARATQSGANAADLATARQRAEKAESEVAEARQQTEAALAAARQQAAEALAEATAKASQATADAERRAAEHQARADAAIADAGKARADYLAVSARVDALYGDPVSPGIRRITTYTYATDDGEKHPTHAGAVRHYARLEFAAALNSAPVEEYVPRDAALKAMVAIRQAATPKIDT